ncbi:hypothetical protein P7K49_028633 [Saguinus oedipus]|uniref:Uncharacterized protein n=1 Tax=Saguinus oedipus TaxID=9490 RepID=A0ABQ9U4W8_SAGOE|nr:hypothetical protein P7K49_028633 [Saguinus oedipus]
MTAQGHIQTLPCSGHFLDFVIIKGRVPEEPFKITRNIRTRAVSVNSDHVETTGLQPEFPSEWEQNVSSRVLPHQARLKQSFSACAPSSPGQPRGKGSIVPALRPSCSQRPGPLRVMEGRDWN